jgi:hypothetical protein
LDRRCPSLMALIATIDFMRAILKHWTLRESLRRSSDGAGSTQTYSTTGRMASITIITILSSFFLDTTNTSHGIANRASGTLRGDLLPRSVGPRSTSEGVCGRKGPEPRSEREVSASAARSKSRIRYTWNLTFPSMRRMKLGSRFMATNSNILSACGTMLLVLFQGFQRRKREMLAGYRWRLACSRRHRSGCTMIAYCRILTKM